MRIVFKYINDRVGVENVKIRNNIFCYDKRDQRETHFP